MSESRISPPVERRPNGRFGNERPIAIIGAGPVGLVAAAHLRARGLTPVVLELGQRAGWNIRRWGHVRLFTPWRYLIDEVAETLLRERGWSPPPPNETPTGREFVERFLDPLEKALSDSLVFDARVTAITRTGMDRLKTDGRDDTPFEVRFTRADGDQDHLLARAVIDASGTYGTPNPAGSNGIPARGEDCLSTRPYYGVPDTLGADRDRFAGRRVAVVGGGHSAYNALLDLVALQREEPETTPIWVVRGSLSAALQKGGASDDALVERGKLELALRDAVAQGRIQSVDEFGVAALERNGPDLSLSSEDGRVVGPLHEIVVATGYRPDLSLTRELRLDLDSIVEAPRELAPKIDPNLHSCGTVPPHGFAELGHPERDFFTVGMKSYGRAPTFLLITGYEQVRSVSCYLAGDMEGAMSVRLELPETGVCVTDRLPTDLGLETPESQCCGDSPGDLEAAQRPADGASDRVAL